MYLDCPLNELCPLDAEDCLEFGVEPESDDVRSWYVPELVHQECPCELTGEEWEAVDRSITIEHIMDYINGWEL